MDTIKIEYPEGLPYSLKMSSKEFGDYARFILAAKLFELGKVSSGVAAKMCGLNRREFLEKLAPHGIPAINIDEEQAELESEWAKKI